MGTDPGRDWRAGPATAAVDRALYALFSGHADRDRHATDRRRFRAAALSTSFERFVARLYGLSVVVYLATFALALLVAVSLSTATVQAGWATAVALVPPLAGVPADAVPRPYAAVGIAVIAGGLAKHGTVRLGGTYLRWVASARRTDIERTLPAAVRYLRALAAGTDDREGMCRRVAEAEEAYGETAVALRRALNRAALTGNLDEGLRMVARDTPSRDLLAPFLLKFAEHGSQGADALAGYLRLESRMLSQRQARARDQAQGFLELLAELFVVLLVLPALFVIVLTVMSVLAPGLSREVATPVGTTTVRGVVVWAAVGFVLATGGLAAWITAAVRPPGLGTGRYVAPERVREIIRTAPTNPASAVRLGLPLGVAVTALAMAEGVAPLDALLAGYALVALPVGVVAARRARLDDRKDREIADFVHAISGHVTLGRPFDRAVERVAAETELGPLAPDVADLAFNAGLTTGPETAGRSRRAAALDRFVGRVGTPLAEQTIGLVTGALEAGGDADDVFETLQVEIGRLYHEKRALRSAMVVYAAVGWMTALLVVGIMVAVDAYVIDGFAQLGTLATPRSGLALDPGAIQPDRERRRFYAVTQATMLACGWFSGTASRGRYEALLHSGCLAVLAAVVFAGVAQL